MEPDAQARGVVQLIFEKFTELGSGTAVFHYLLENDIKRWAEDYLSALVDGPPARNVLAGIRALFGGSPDQGPFATR